ncbi:MAG: Nif3-like dinuclear metal center hexameric protein [Prevotella sp.]
MKINKVVEALERFAPLPLQESYDNAGLQVGLTEAEVSGALLCLDVTEAVVDEAIARGCNLIVAHHPLIFHKLSSITGADYVQRCVAKAIKNDIAILAMHTNMDNAVGGVNYRIADKLGLSDVETLECRSMDINGEKTPYGSVVMGIEEKPLSAQEFIQKVKSIFNVDCVQANQLLKRKIQKVAICGGAGSFALQTAIDHGADAFITGEMHYHEFFGHEQEIQIAVIGHYQSEQFTNEIFRDIINKECPEVECLLTKTNTNPILYL